MRSILDGDEDDDEDDDDDDDDDDDECPRWCSNLRNYHQNAFL